MLLLASALWIKCSPCLKVNSVSASSLIISEVFQRSAFASLSETLWVCGGSSGAPCEGWPTVESEWQQLEAGWDWRLGARCRTEAAASPSSPRKHQIVVTIKTQAIPSSPGDNYYTETLKTERAEPDLNNGGKKKNAPTLGTAAWKRMLVTGTGAEDSMEMITTRTSGLDGGQSCAKVNKTLRLCLSNTVKGNKLPEM